MAKKKKKPLKKKKAVKKSSKKKSPAKKKAIKKTRKKASLPKRKLKKTAKKKKAAKVVKKPVIKGNIAGNVTHYFPQVRAAVIKLKKPLKVGDIIKIKGHTTDFTQGISSMQIDRVPVQEAGKGKEIGVLVDSRVRRRDVVIKI